MVGLFSWLETDWEFAYSYKSITIKQNKEGTELKVICCCGYNTEKEEDRERAISEVQEEIQRRNYND